ncbi:hypothetical protein SEUCBS139899_001197 [Sporothrix eucalyptigena]|uniref:BZIP domain-containing protein n=1 Tax=Sporothrix eucalyptigena TaxID=1812306 RepID=A0ABP0BSB4_9PEZI
MAPQNDEANLARIRDNQRRSRARRKEYQQELEQRVRAFEEQGVEASTEVQHAARRVAEENKKLRALLQHNGVSHASIEAYLRTGDVSSAEVGSNVQTLEHLMVPRFPLQYSTSPLLSAAGSVGPSSPSGAADEGSGGYFSHDVTTSATSSPPLATTSKTGGASSSTRGSGGASSSHNRSSHGHRSSGDKTKKSSSSSTSHRHSLVSTTLSAGGMSASTTTTSGGYLSPGYGLPTTFYGLDATSAEDLQYSAAEPTFFDYSVSPQYLGTDVGTGSGGGSSGTSVTGAGMAGVSQTPVSTSYYGHVQGLVGTGGSSGSYVRTCPACMSGMGCQVHGGFFDE